MRQATESALDNILPKKEKAWGDDSEEKPLFLKQELTWICKDTLPLEGEKASSALALLEDLEDHEDVQNIWSDLSVPDDAIAD